MTTAGAHKVPRLPDFFILGAQKAATTSLDAWLRSQPGVALPDLKETHFLSEDERFAKGLAWYLGRFKTPAGPSNTGRSALGEVDPDYISDARVPARMERMYAEVESSPRLVAVLREPVARAYSQWAMSTRRGLERRPFAEALEASLVAHQTNAPSDRHRDYYARGCYAEQLARFDAAVPDSERLVLLFEEVVDPKMRQRTFRGLCEFVGVPGEPVEPAFDAIKNAAGRSRSRLVNRLLFGGSGVKRALRTLVPSQDLRLKLGVLLDRANTTRAKTPAVRMSTLSPVVCDAIQQDTQELEALLDRDLTPWQEALAGHRSE